jgi:hypothetical protein
MTAAVAATPKNWVDDEDDTPLGPVITENPDGTKTVVEYGVNDDGKKIKVRPLYIALLTISRRRRVKFEWF